MTFCLLHVQGLVGLGVEVIPEAFFIPFSHTLPVAAQSTDILLAFGRNTGHQHQQSRLQQDHGPQRGPLQQHRPQTSAWFQVAA